MAVRAQSGRPFTDGACPTILNPMLRNYRFPLLILTGVVVGAIVGLVAGEQAAALKPIGRVFINMMFTLVVPLVFFSIASAVAAMESAKRLGKIMGSMLLVFIATGIVASLVMLSALWLFRSNAPLDIALGDEEPTENPGSFGDQLVDALTVRNVSDLLSPSHMLALIVFAILVGFATTGVGKAGAPFAAFLRSGSEVFLKFTSIVMYYAPIGLGAYFAALIGELGPQLVGGYLRAFAVYFPVAIAYFLLGFTLYSFIAGGWPGVRRFWRNILEPAMVSLGTGSSVATLPANLQAAQRNGVPRDIRETILPIGATIHMEGSCLSAILKISFLFTLFQRDLFTPQNMLIAIGISLLSGMVMSGIPSGGFVGELMIVTMYGFPPGALPIISIIGTIVDAPATSVNAIGDNCSSMLVARMIDGPGWMAVGDAETAAGDAAESIGAAAGGETGAVEPTADHTGRAAGDSGAKTPRPATASRPD